MVVACCAALVGAVYLAKRVGSGDRSCTTKTSGQLDPGQRCSLTGEILPLQEGQRELGTLQTATVFGEGKKYNQFNLRDEAGVVSIHFIAAEVLLPPTGRHVRVDVEVAEVIAGAKVLVAEDWDFVN